MYIESLCQACEATLNLENAELSSSYYYDSLPQCVIDAVFSIGVKYTSTTNVVKSYCAYYGLRVHNRDHDQKGNKHTISQLIDHITSTGVRKSADVIFQNHQRTSTRNGILKADAVLRFARVLQKYGVETLADMLSKGLPLQAEVEIMRIPGQKSGLSLRYLYMLSGDDSQSKPDRHVMRFFEGAYWTGLLNPAGAGFARRSGRDFARKISTNICAPFGLFHLELYVSSWAGEIC